MYIILWHFKIKEEYIDNFISAYGPNGTWAELFRKDQDYKGTRLLHDVENKLIFVTIDVWESKESFVKFKKKYEEEYHKLDREFEKFTTAEKLISEFDNGGNKILL
ncbi:MAG: hypothetical protein HYS25_03710 [Ignavibacteriales bacterium]|nr:hypothetical protein [Ignavibacteriales bacterium]